MKRYVDSAEQLVVELLVRDVARSLTFYRSLGFVLVREEQRFAILAWEGHQLLLQQGDNLPEPPATAVINLRVMVPDVDRIWQLATELGPPIVVPIGDRHYGLRDFTIADPDGFELRFATHVPAIRLPGRVVPKLDRLLESALYVDDPERLARFYHDLLGFEVIVAGERMHALSVEGQQVLLLFKKGASTKITSPPPHDGDGQLHLAFAIPAAELSAWETWLAQNGVTIEEKLTWTLGGCSLYFRDPDQHLVELATPGVWTIY